MYTLAVLGVVLWSFFGLELDLGTRLREESHQLGLDTVRIVKLQYLGLVFVALVLAVASIPE